MTGWRHSLRWRLTIAQAVAAALVFFFLGTMLYRSLEARLVQVDRDQLRRYALVMQHIARASPGGDDLGELQRRLHDLLLIHPDMRGSLGPEHEVPGAAEDVADAPIRAAVIDGVSVEALEIRIAREGHPSMQLSLAVSTHKREQRLRQYRNTLLAVAVAGVLAAIALSAFTMRWGVRGLHRLSWEASRMADGGRLDTGRVDSELVELVQAFNATLDKLELAYRQSESFSADVAHELRSPLATLISGTQLMLRGPARTIDQLREALASNLEELERLKTLVNDMLFLARADQGERAQSLERVDLGELADATIDYCGVLLDEAGLTVSRHGAASAVCNAALIRRAMANLLSNAIQYASGACRIELHLEPLPGRVRMWVFNSGAPLPKEVSARMFDRFFRASAGARGQAGERHGLGLAIVQAVARMHGGHVFAMTHADGNAIGLDIPGALATTQRRLREPEPGSA